MRVGYPRHGPIRPQILAVTPFNADGKTILTPVNLVLRNKMVNQAIRMYRQVGAKTDGLSWVRW
jgi:hypothetical protein